MILNSLFDVETIKSTFAQFKNAQKDFNLLLSAEAFDSKNIDAYASALNGLTLSQQKAIVTGAELGKEQKQEIITRLEQSATTNVATVSTEKNTLSNQKNSLSLKGIATSAKAAWSSMSLLSKVSIIAMAIGTVVSIVNAITTSTEEYKEKLNDLKGEYNEITSEIQSVNSELETTIDRMKELEGKDSLTFTEKEEYANLVKTNNELQRKIDLLKLEQEQKNKEKNKTFVDTMNSDTENPFEHEVNPNGRTETQYQVSDNYLTSEMGYIEAQFKIRNQLLNDLSNAESIEDRERIQKRIDNIDTYLQEKNEEWAKNADGISYITNPTTKDDEEVNKWLDYINDFQDRMAIATSGSNASANAKYKTNAFNRIVDSLQFDETVQGLQDLGKEGKVTAEMLDNPKYDEFINKLVFLGVIDSAEDLNGIALAFNSVAIEAKNAGDATSDLPNNVSFLNAFNSSDFAEHKEELLELARTGEITPDVLKSTEEYATLLSKTGLSAEEVMGEILNLLNAQEKLAGATNGLDRLKGSYEEFKDLGFVTAATLQELPKEFTSLDGYDLFSKIVGDPQSGADAIQQAFNDIVSEYLVTYETLNSYDLISDDYDEQQRAISTYIANLKEMGITNAEEIVNVTVAEMEAQEKLINDAEEEYTNYLENKDGITLEYIESTDSINTQLINALGTQYKDDYNNWLNLLEEKELAFEKFKNAVTTGDVEYTVDELLNTSVERLLAKKGSFNANDYAYVSKLKADYLAITEKYDKARKELITSVGDDANYESKFSTKYDGTSGSSKDSDSTLDWVEIAVTRAEEELDRLNTAIDNTYSNWTDRSNALKDAIIDTQTAITLQGQAYDTYMAKANSVNLPEYLKERVRLGDMSIQNDVNSDTKKLIDEYSKWYNKALDAQKAQEELNQTLNELKTSDKVDMIEEYYDALTEAKENGIEKFQNKIDMAETQGFFANNSYYEGIESIIEEEIAIVAKKKDDLDKILANSEALKGTAAYTELENLVASVSNELDELYIKIEDNKNAAQENEWNYFDYLRESVSRLIDEADYLIELLSSEDLFDDKGNFTKYADATLALHSSNYEVYMENAREHAEEVKALEKDLADGKDVVDRYNEMVDAHQDAVLAAQKEKQAILDLVEEGYQKQLDYLNELIDKKKESLTAEKDLYDYQKSIEEKTKTRDSLRRQLDVYKNDTSEEGLAQAQKLSVELQKAEDDLAETEYDKMISDQQAMLDALSNDYEQWMNQRLDNEDELLKQILDNLSDDGKIATTLKEISDKYGVSMTQSFTDAFTGTDPFKDVTTAINNLIEKISGIVTTDDSKSNGDNSSGGSTDNVPQTPTTPDTPTTPTTTQDQPIDTQSKSEAEDIFIPKKDYYPKEKLNKDTSIVDRLKYHDFASDFQSRAIYYKKLGGSGTYTASASQNTWLIKKMKENGFAKGGTIGSLIKRTGEDGLVLARTGEEILSLEKIEAIKDMLQYINPVMSNLNIAKMPNIQPRSSANEVSLGGIHIAQVVANNPQEFVQQMKQTLANDRTVQKMVQEVGLGGALGNNSMNVKRYL